MRNPPDAMQQDQRRLRLIAPVKVVKADSIHSDKAVLRRLRKRMPDVPVMALFWGLAGDSTRYLDGIEATECDIVTTGLKESVQHIIAFARRSEAAARHGYQAAK